MKFIDKVKEESYVQWIEQFVLDILDDCVINADINADVVTVTDIEFSKRIILDLDGKEYTIRTWNFIPIDYDQNNNPCSEVVDWTLFKIVGDHGIEVTSGHNVMQWVN